MTYSNVHITIDKTGEIRRKQKKTKKIIPITSDRFVVVGSSDINFAATLATLAVYYDDRFQRDRGKNGPAPHCTYHYCGARMFQRTYHSTSSFDYL